MLHVRAGRRSATALLLTLVDEDHASASARKPGEKSSPARWARLGNANALPAGWPAAASPTSRRSRWVADWWRRLAQADARAVTAFSARAEAEFHAIVAKRDARIVELKRQLAEKTEALHQLTFASSSRRTARASRFASPLRQISRTRRRRRACWECTKHASVAPLAAAAAKRRGEMADTPPTRQPPRREEDTTELGGDPELESPPSNRARARAPMAEVTRLTAELAVSRANAPSPEEMEALQDEATALRRRLRRARRGVDSRVRGGGVFPPGVTQTLGRWMRFPFLRRQARPRPRARAAAEPPPPPCCSSRLLSETQNALLLQGEARREDFGPLVAVGRP